MIVYSGPWILQLTISSNPSSVNICVTLHKVFTYFMVLFFFNNSTSHDYYEDYMGSHM